MFVFFHGLQARNGSTDVSDFTSSLMWIEARDTCDPETLRHRPKVCHRTIHKCSEISQEYH